MSYERPKRFVATRHRGNGGWLHAVFVALVIVGAVTGTSAANHTPAHDESCDPAVIRPGQEASADALLAAGWVDPTGAGRRIYPPGCEASR